jgi:hypothetical protein
MNYSLLRSRTFWTVVAMFVVGGGNAIVPILPPAFQALVEGLLGILAAYFHKDGMIAAGARN